MSSDFMLKSFVKMLGIDESQVNIFIDEAREFIKVTRQIDARTSAIHTLLALDPPQDFNLPMLCLDISRKIENLLRMFEIDPHEFNFDPVEMREKIRRIISDELFFALDPQHGEPRESNE